ncbi:hypothetical protein KCP71_01850 [Salmonella enterica subsp. enterica]|nr:hypothetical protein KCP71_01850 [Salmonella enterica subsp. enterica]
MRPDDAQLLSAYLGLWEKRVHAVYVFFGTLKARAGICNLFSRPDPKYWAGSAGGRQYHRLTKPLYPYRGLG